MPRRAQIIIPGVAHHITQRGNNRQIIFEEEKDFSHYCYWLNKYSIKYNVAVLAYCLMTNHVHFIVVPENENGISRLFNTVHMRYAQYINSKKETSGHLWQGRFYSCVLDDGHLFYAIRYVEQNPVRANMVARPWDYEWSSTRWHVNMYVKRFIKVRDTTIIHKKYWKKYLLNSDDNLNDEIRRKTYKGKAFASDNFIIYWEHKLNCVLSELEPGRKKEIGRCPLLRREHENFW